MPTKAEIYDTAQKICQQAVTGPSPDGKTVRNLLSPHLERFIAEAIRARMLQGISEVKTQVATLTDTLQTDIGALTNAFDPETMTAEALASDIANTVSLAQAQLNAAINNLLVWSDE